MQFLPRKFFRRLIEPCERIIFPFSPAVLNLLSDSLVSPQFFPVIKPCKILDNGVRSQLPRFHHPFSLLPPAAKLHHCLSVPWTPEALQLPQDCCICSSACPDCFSAFSIYCFLTSPQLNSPYSEIISMTTLFKGRSCLFPTTVCHMTLFISFLTLTTARDHHVYSAFWLIAVFLHWDVCSTMLGT